MTVIDKTRAMARIRQQQCSVLELGCGARKRHPDAIGIDKLDYSGVDLVGDVFEVLRSVPSASIQTVHTYHFLEHVADFPALLDVLARVVKPGGVLDVEVPHFSNPYFYSDPTHSRFFGLYTFSYLAEEHLFRRRVPHYGGKLAFEVTDVHLDFASPFLFRGVLKRAVGPLFNMTRWLQEFYEENLCHIFPCYQLRVSLRRLP